MKTIKNIIAATAIAALSLPALANHRTENISRASTTTEIDTLRITDGIEELRQDYFKDYTGRIECDVLILPQSLKRIEESALRGIHINKTIVFPESLEYIGNYAFADGSCPSMDLPVNLKEIGEYAFYNFGCRSISFNGTCSTIGQYAFWCSFCLEELLLPSDLKEIPYAMIRECKLTEIEIPASVKTIQEECTFGGDGLVNTPNAPSVLKRVIMHDGIEEIKSKFNLASDHYPLIVPSTVKKMTYASLGSKNAVLYLCPTTPPEVTNGIGSGMTLYVPRGCKELYAQAAGWSNAQEIIEVDDEAFELAAIGDIAPEQSAGEAVVTADCGAIRIESLTGRALPYAIYSIDGRIAASGIAAPSATASLAEGFYVVKAGTTSMKVRL